MKENQLVELLERLSLEFHQILEKNKSYGKFDGIISSISLTIDNALKQISSNLPITAAVICSIDQAAVVAVKTFEGSGIDDDLFVLKILINKYYDNFSKKIC